MKNPNMLVSLRITRDAFNACPCEMTAGIFQNLLEKVKDAGFSVEEIAAALR